MSTHYGSVTIGNQYYKAQYLQAICGLHHTADPCWPRPCRTGLGAVVINDNAVGSDGTEPPGGYRVSAWRIVVVRKSVCRAAILAFGMVAVLEARARADEVIESSAPAASWCDPAGESPAQV